MPYHRDDQTYEYDANKANRNTGDYNFRRDEYDAQRDLRGNMREVSCLG
ncbi:unnamed protein product [Trichobilharzia regenti]|nr:unnamed protein product [Trichobilharzia regenti]